MYFFHSKARTRFSVYTNIVQIQNFISSVISIISMIPQEIVIDIVGIRTSSHNMCSLLCIPFSYLVLSNFKRH